MPRAQQWLLRITGTLALLLFLTPTFYVLKYYSVDRPREERRAARVSLARIVPAVPVDVVAPPLEPQAHGNAAAFYTRAIQAYADRSHAGHRMPNRMPDFPTPVEIGALFEGARRRDCRFFGADPRSAPLYAFRDPDAGFAPLPYRFPTSDREKYRYLSAAIGLAGATAQAARTGPAGDPHQRVLGQVLLRFGDALGREEATRTHLAAAQIVKRIAVRLLLPFGDPNLRRYAESENLFNSAVQTKYALLEPITPDNLLLQARVAQHDADPLWRREAVWALGNTLSAPGISWQHPLESLSAKATLSDAAVHDPDLSVRAAASETLGQIARHGAVIQR